MHSTLQLVRRARSAKGPATSHEFLDFVVDGRSLLDLLGGLALVGCLGWGDGVVQRAAAERLLLRLPSGLESGRVPLYVCAECGDLDCGAVTAHIERTADAFVWSDFGMEGGAGSEVTRYPKWKDLGPFAFHKTEYWQALHAHPAA
jgi:hypothetical protein